MMTRAAGESDDETLARLGADALVIEVAGLARGLTAGVSAARGWIVGATPGP